jgi:hypothetical protein
MPKKLKVFRTPIGFHDAYVAAPSQKAALQAWGSDANLFARGIAEIVTDPELTKEPLARPGEVIKRTRGTLAEQIAALPADAPRGRVKENTGSNARKSQPNRQPKPRPDRSELDAAETEVADAKARQRAELKELEQREAELAKERRDIERVHETELRRLKRAEERARAAYQRAMARWRG